MVLVTMTAPIRLPGKTVTALEEKMQALLEGKSPAGDKQDTIHGNRVRIRVLKGQHKDAPKMIGFVHNRDSDPLQLLDMTGELLELASAAVGKQADRWLVAVSERGSSCLAAYRYIYSQLDALFLFKKAVMVFGDGRAETLTD